MVGGVTPPPTRNTPPPTPPPSPGPTPGPLPSPTPRPWPVPMPPPTPGPAEGGPGTPFGSPRFRRLICGKFASCGATTVGSTISFGSGFFGGSGSGGTICLSAALGNFPSEGGVIVFLPPPPPPPDFSLSGETGSTRFMGWKTITAVSVGFGVLGND